MRIELTKGIYRSDPSMYVLEIELCPLNEKIELQADTGFSGGVLLPESYSKKFDERNIISYPEYFDLADGDLVVGRVYLVDIKRIGEYRCDHISSSVLCYGRGTPLIGLELLNRWICEFDGPNNCLTLFNNE